MMTFWPDKAMMPLLSSATRSYHSPEMVDVTEINAFLLPNL
jgi:hypothetical protein